MLRSRLSFLVAASCLIPSACGRGAARPAGAELFRTQCASCHTLTGQDSPRRQGGDLLGYRLTRIQLRQYIREMPTRRPLTGREARAVEDYVLAAQRGHALPQS